MTHEDERRNESRKIAYPLISDPRFSSRAIGVCWVTFFVFVIFSEKGWSSFESVARDNFLMFLSLAVFFSFSFWPYHRKNLRDCLSTAEKVENLRKALEAEPSGWKMWASAISLGAAAGLLVVLF